MNARITGQEEEKDIIDSAVVAFTLGAVRVNRSQNPIGES
jgi:hypothetical protein